MKIRRKMLFALALALIAAGCGGDSSPTGPTTTTTTAPSLPARANITMTILDVGGLATGQGNVIGFQIRLTESAGVGANINFIRVQVFRATGEFEESQEIGAADIISQTGTNRLEGNQTRELTAILAFNATIKTGRVLRLTVGMTDDRGNNQDKTADFIFS